MQVVKNQNLKLAYQVLGGLFTCFALILQLYLIVKNTPASGKTYLSEIVRYFSFMTIWTNILVALSLVVPIIAKNSRLGQLLSKPIMQTATMLYITFVGVAYHFLLANVWSPTGLQKVADVSLHYIVPFLYIIYWVLFVTKGEQQFGYSIKWMIYPLIYCIYAMIRGAMIHEYPYHFIDVTELGYAVAIKNSLLLAVGYFLGGIILILFDRGVIKFRFRRA